MVPSFGALASKEERSLSLVWLPPGRIYLSLIHLNVHCRMQSKFITGSNAVPLKARHAMTIKKVRGTPNFAEIIDLINSEWPPEFGRMSDEEKIEHMKRDYDARTDTVKYLLDGGKIIGFYRYTLCIREKITGTN